jgi:hypothetical protein
MTMKSYCALSDRVCLLSMKGVGADRRSRIFLTDKPSLITLYEI